MARAQGAVTVSVQAPVDPNQRVAFLSVVENIEVDPGDAAAKVVINSRTGTVVIGSRVRVMPAAVSHGSLAVTISEKPQVSQPAPFPDGQRSEEHTSELQSLMRISYAVFCLKKKNQTQYDIYTNQSNE